MRLTKQRTDTIRSIYATLKKRKPNQPQREREIETCAIFNMTLGLEADLHDIGDVITAILVQELIDQKEAKAL